jgi:hemerythrin-like domain-containing protein
MSSYRGTRLALQYLTKDTNAVSAACHRYVEGGYAMPTRRHHQAQPKDAIAMLKADHQKVRKLFQQYEAIRDPRAKRKVAEQVFIELETHAQLEEHVFYPAVNEETEDGPALVKESLAEHETMKHLIQELRNLGPDPNVFDAKFSELIHQVEHHVEAEEAEMFPLAEEELEEDMKDLRDEMQELKADLQSS